MVTQLLSKLTPAIGDILLLVSKNKLRKPNTTYQSVARKKIARYSHVAIVFSPQSIIDATPENGIQIRRWDFIKHHYHINLSKVARNQRFASNQDNLKNIIKRMQYYYGQPYALSAALRNKPNFVDGEGLVCSQFIACVFADIGISTSSTSPRKTLPIDIDIFTRRTTDWSRFNLSHYSLGSSIPDNDLFTKQLIETVGTLDDYFAKSTAEVILISKASMMLNTIAQFSVNAFKSGQMTFEEAAKLVGVKDLSDTKLSAYNLISSWSTLFATLEYPPRFLHEELSRRDGIREGFIHCCKELQHFIEVTNPQQDHLIQGALNDAQTLLKLMIERVKRGLDCSDMVDTLNKIRQYLSNILENKDNVFSDDTAASIATRIAGYPELMKKVVKNPKVCLDDAYQCLKTIMLFDLAHQEWLHFRPTVLELIEIIDTLLREAGPPSESHNPYLNEAT